MWGFGGGGGKQVKAIVVRDSWLISGHPLDTTPPPDPGPIVPDVHEPFGVQHFGGPLFPLAPDIARSRAELFYPVRMDVAFDMDQVMSHPIQIEQDPGFLADLYFYPGPGGLSTQYPSANLPTHMPLEGVIYNDSQISESDYLALATARVQAQFGGG